MANEARNVAVGKPLATGGAYRGPTGTPTPVGVDDAKDSALVGTGYISNEGIVQAIGSETSDVVAWGGDTVRKVQTSHDVTYALTMIEQTAAAQGAYYGDDNVAVTPATAEAGTLTEIHITSAELDRGVWVFELRDGLRRGRIVLPDAQVTERGDVSYVDEDAIAYPVTLSAYPDSDGVKAYIYWDDGVFATAG